MKVVIVGGYGVFGALAARLLVRDGHQVWLAGRRPEKGRAIAKEIGAQTLKVDILDNTEALFQVKPDAVIDAAGPFQNYGSDPYKLPRLCIVHGCHYLDLSDSSDFTGGISTLNAEAEAAQVFALSGASSVPGLSSVVVSNLSRDMTEIDEIDIAILPGNRAPRGLSVIKSIVGVVGRPYQILRDGSWQETTGWTDRKDYTLAPGLTRPGYSVNVPDITLLPQMTGAKTVTFRAGLELALMNWALVLLSRLRQRARLELPEPVIRALYLVSKILYPFGTDRGGMQVRVSGKKDGQRVERIWTLVAEKGDGPYVPGMLCRAILRNPDAIPAGARPCLAELPRAEVEAAMSDLAIRTNLNGLANEQRESDRAPAPPQA
ncbi:MAG: saccharopine dehydrogenase NADP-binding domain-containing protein [Pseudomonadota bacterium]